MISLDAYSNGVLAQLGEHLPCTQGVIGSIPIRSTICKIQTAYAVFFYILRFWFRNREMRYVKNCRIVTIC